MIDLSSVRIKERLADGDVIVVEVSREPLLAQGLLGVFDIRLCDEVVVGLITCGGFVVVQGTWLLGGSEHGCCLLTSGKVEQKEVLEAKDDEEEESEVDGEVEERERERERESLNVRMKHDE